MSHDVSRCFTVSHPASQISGRGCHWPSELQASRLVLLGSDLDSQANACRPEFHRISLQTRWVGNNSTISRSAPKMSKPHYHPPPVLHPKSHLFLGRIRIRIRSELSSSSSWWPSPSCFMVLPLSLSPWQFLIPCCSSAKWSSSPPWPAVPSNNSTSLCRSWAAQGSRRKSIV